MRTDSTRLDGGKDDMVETQAAIGGLDSYLHNPRVDNVFNLAGLPVRYRRPSAQSTITKKRKLSIRTRLVIIGFRRYTDRWQS